MLTGDPDRQPPFLSYGFRPFFLFAGLYAVVAMAAWAGWLAIHALGGVVIAPTIAVAPYLWHGHEMLFGYGSAVLGGFILTAIPNWTGARRLAGTPLILLAGLWIAGRGAMWVSVWLAPWIVAVLDMAFLPVLAGFVGAGLMIRPAPRNLVFLGLLALLIVANAMVHAEWMGWTEATASRGLTLALATLTLTLVIVGGRIVPAFTRNALIGEADDQNLPRSLPMLDRLSVLLAASIVACVLVDAPDGIAGSVALGAALANAARLSLWRGAAMLRRPIVWSLHLGYLWIVLGYGALALAGLTDLIGQTAAWHMLGVGAVGGMTLAVMTRAALGHTGRRLVAHRAVAWAYLTIAVAAIIRGLGPLIVADHYLHLMIVAGCLWIAGFTIFVAAYWPILTGPSLKAPIPRRISAA